MQRKLVIIISIAFAVLALAAGTVVIVIFGSKNAVETTAATPDQAVTLPFLTQTQSSSAAEISTQAPTESVTEALSETIAETFADDPAAADDTADSSAGTDAPPEEETVGSIEAPEELVQLLEVNGNSIEELNDSGCRQLITVQSEGSSANIDFYQVVDNQWTLMPELSCSGYVGSNGVTADMYEGGYASPMGLYSIGEAFYISQMPETGLDVFRITPETYWVDDPASEYYNMRVEGQENADWNSAEHMASISGYEVGFVINYNTEARIRGAGSAIFFHISSSPTAGCVGTSYENVLSYLRALDKTQNPHILIL